MSAPLTSRTVRCVAPCLALTAMLVLLGLGLLRAGDAPTTERESGPDRLTSRSRPAAPVAKVLKVGDVIRTGERERRRLLLPDGSVLYVNQQSQVRFDAARRLVLASGEVYLETAPDGAGAKFTVKTPKVEIAGLASKFAVRSEAEGTGITVLCGQVTVSGLADPVHAGQMLAAGKEKPISAARGTRALDWTRDLMAAAESPLVPGSSFDGGALLAVDPNGQEAKLELRKYHVDVHIEDGFARTTIDQTYFNHHTQRLEGTFYFPLPPDASLSQLAMYVDGNLMQGGMAERDYARNIYENMVYRQKDPALLEWVDGSTFKMRVFPLEGRQEKRIVLSYTQKLGGLYDKTTYRFPAGHSLGIVRDWSFHARVKNGAALAWTGDSHRFEAGKDNADLLLDASEKNAKLDRDVVFSFSDPGLVGQTEDSARFATVEHEGAKYLMLRYRPVLAGKSKREPRNWVFLFESSGDRDPLLARVQIDVIEHLLKNVEAEDTFAVLTAGTRVRSLAKALRPVTPENIQSAITFLESTHLIGAFDLGLALNEAQAFLKLGKNPYLVHVGSGHAAMGEARTDVLVQRIPEGTRYVGVGVGRRWARNFMKTAAERTGGHFTQINPDEPITWRAFDLASTLQAPRLMDLRVEDSAKNGRFLNIGDTIAQGEELCAITRLGADQKMPESVTIAALLDGQRVERAFAVKNVATGAGYLPRTWAKLEIDRLLADNAAKHKPKIVELSKAMYVMTPFTSLLVLENDDMYTQFKVDRGRKDHWAMYPCPGKIPVIREPLPGQDDASAKKKMTAADVLRTIVTRDRLRFLSSDSASSDKPLPTGGVAGITFENARSEDAKRAQSAELLNYYNRSRSAGRFREAEMYAMKARELDPDNPAVDAALYTARIMRNQRDLIKSGKEQHFVNDLNSAEDPGIPITSSSFGRAIPPYGGYPGTEFFSRDASTIIVGNSVTRQNVNLRQLPVQPGQILSYPDLRVGERNLTRQGIFQLDGEKGIRPTVEVLNPDGPSRVKDVLVNVYEDRTGSLMFGLGVNSDAGVRGSLPTPATLLAPSLGLPPMVSLNRVPSLYDRPSFSSNDRIFYDLVAYAPGMNTTLTDIEAVLEAEAIPSANAVAGRIDPAARKLIDGARSADWRTLTVLAKGNLPAFAITFDGTGRYTYERTLQPGLRERVVCDGETVLHLYPDLAIGARRTMGRAYRLELARSLPWVLPTAEDLAVGADLELIGVRTVAIAPRGAASVKDSDGKPIVYARQHLVFGANGRLAERQIVEMPANKVLQREVIGEDGVVKVIDAKGKEIAVHKGTLAAAKAPELKPDTKKLVVLPLPYRTPEHVAKSLKVENPKAFKGFTDLRFAEAMPLFAAHFATGKGDDAYQVFRQAFYDREQRQLGFYVLLAACGQNLDGEHLDVMGQHFEEPLPQYLALYSSPVLRKHASQWAVGTGQWKEGGLQDLAISHSLLQRWQSGRFVGLEETQRLAEFQRGLQYVQKNKDTVFGWLLLGLMLDRVADIKTGNGELYRKLAEACRLYEDVPGLGYSALYEHARCLWKAGEKADSRRAFRELYEKTFAAGILPPIDAEFRQALLGDAGSDPWSELLRQTAGKLVEQKERPAIFALAWQCWQIGDQPLANHLVSHAIDRVADEKERLPLTLAAIHFMTETSQLPQADQMLQTLLADEKLAKLAYLWRFAAKLAEKREMKSRELACLERALDAEYQHLPPVINLQEVRSDYGRLLSHYQTLAESMVTLKVAPPRDFVVKVIRTADRWRALDSDGSDACRSAAGILQTLGDRDLVWDYLTTPIALKPNESDPWLGLAEALSRKGEIDLADRAFATAFEVEPTNAQILWDRAQNLKRAGRADSAEKLFRQLADGKWQPRFQGLQTQARWQGTGLHAN